MIFNANTNIEIERSTTMRAKKKLYTFRWVPHLVFLFGDVNSNGVGYNENNEDAYIDAYSVQFVYKTALAI